VAAEKRVRQQQHHGGNSNRLIYGKFSHVRRRRNIELNAAAAERKNPKKE